MNLSIVTAAWGAYGQYLPAWLKSIAAQTVPPEEIVVVNCGLYDPIPLHKALDDLPIHFRYIQRPYGGVGKSRNHAVRSSSSEWVMHLDADDVLLPTAIEDVMLVSHDADVVALGSIAGAIVGKDTVTYRDQTRLFHRTTAQTILSGALGCYSCSPFRRSFWERRPYIEENDWVDSVFWVGLAHLGARFVGTRRPGFVYRAHDDSHSRTMSKDQKAEAMDQFRRLLKGWDM